MHFLTIPIHFIAAFCASAIANWIGLIPWRKSAGAHWTERARILWPVRFTAAINVLLIPVIFFEFQSALTPRGENWWIANGAAAFLGAVLGTYPFDREVFPRLDFREWRRQVLAYWGLRFGIWAVFVAAIVLMPSAFCVRTILVATGYLTIHFAIQFGLFLRYLRLVNVLQPAGARLQKIVQEVSDRMNVRVRGLWQLAGAHANALAFPTTGDLVFTNRLLAICDDEEIAGICAHELAHLSESKKVVVGRLLGSLTLFPLIFIVPCTIRLGPLGLLLPYAGMFVILRFSRWLSQRLEKRADREALSGTNNAVYARALEKLYRENQAPAVNPNNKQTHPHLYDRLLAAGISPDYPRPLKPARMTWIGCCFWIAFVLSIIWMTARNG